MSFNLWDYQEEGLSSIFDFFEHGGKSVILQSPTGTGKSLIASTFITRMKEQSKPVYFITASGSLLWQFSEHLTELGQYHGIIKSGCPVLRYRIQVISVQSLMKRIDSIDEPYAIIAEECHHFASAQFMKILDKWPRVRILGLTATPSRPDGKPLNMFESIIKSRPVRWFIDNFYLSDFDYFIPAEVNTEGIHHVGGDFNAKELSERLHNDKLRVGSFVKHYEKYAKGLPGIAFGTSIADAEDISNRFVEAGYSMKPLHSKIKGDVRSILDCCRKGQISMLSTCDLVGEGVDVKGLTVEIDARPTESLVIKLQHSGRVLRAHYAKGYDLSTIEGRKAAMEAGGKGKAKILDFSSNYTRHGLPDDEREWSLEGSTKVKTASQYKRCPECQRPVRSFIMTCPACGYMFPVTVLDPDPVEEREGDLIPISAFKPEDKNGLIIKIAREANSMKQAVKIAKEAGANSAAAWYAWRVILKKSV